MESHGMRNCFQTFDKLQHIAIQLHDKKKEYANYFSFQMLYIYIYKYINSFSK